MTFFLLVVVVAIAFAWAADKIEELQHRVAYLERVRDREFKEYLDAKYGSL